VHTKALLLQVIFSAEANGNKPTQNFNSSGQNQLFLDLYNDDYEESMKAGFNTSNADPIGLVLRRIF